MTAIGNGNVQKDDKESKDRQPCITSKNTTLDITTQTLKKREKKNVFLKIQIHMLYIFDFARIRAKALSFMYCFVLLQNSE